MRFNILTTVGIDIYRHCQTLSNYSFHAPAQLTPSTNGKSLNKCSTMSNPPTNKHSAHGYCIVERNEMAKDYNQAQIINVWFYLFEAFVLNVVTVEWTVGRCTKALLSSVVSFNVRCTFSNDFSLTHHYSCEYFAIEMPAAVDSAK